MKKFEFISVCIHKKEKNTTVWEVCDGENARYIEVEIGKDRTRNALICVMNMLGKEGWSLGSQKDRAYMFTMQRKINEV